MGSDFLSWTNVPKAHKNNWNIVSFLLLVFLCLQTQGWAQAGEESVQWKKFEFPEDGFSILMPGKPERVDLLPRSKYYGKEDLTGAKQMRYQARYENLPWYSVVYSVGFTIAPDSFKKPSAEAESFSQARQAFVLNYAGQIVQEREIKYKNKYPGYEIEFEAPLSHAKFRGFKGIARTYVVGDAVFYLKVAYQPKSNPSPKISRENVAKFFDSFQLLSAQE